MNNNIINNSNANIFRIADEFFEELEKSKAKDTLYRVNVSQTRISDKALTYLARFPNLK